MNNLELLKEELISQKTILESKGVTIQTAHTNPSPSEITTALEDIELANFSLATASEEDVTVGKTFYAGNNILKTGTMTNSESQFTNLALFLLGGASAYSFNNLTIPDGLTEIRNYCFHNFGEALSGEITIPEGVTTLGTYAFLGTNISKVNLPSTLTTIGANCFYNATSLKNLEIPDTVTSIGINIYANIKNAEYIYIGTGITTLESNCYKELTYITSVTIPAQITLIKSSNFNVMLALTDFYIKGNSLTCSNSLFLDTHIAELRIWVNFDALASYSTTTNIATHAEHFISEVVLSDGEVFPSSEVDIVWYSNLDDATARTNAITEPNGAGTYYARIAQ